MALCRSILVGVTMFGLGACATSTAGRSTTAITSAIQQPFRDLSLVQDSIPDALNQALLAPYAVDGVESCPKLIAEMVALDAVLGPDVDVRGKARQDTISNVAGALIGGVVGLPYRGILRRVTGAEKRERVFKAAVLAGMVRRGFLKGRASLACSSMVLGKMDGVPLSTGDLAARAGDALRSRPNT